MVDRKAANDSPSHPKTLMSDSRLAYTKRVVAFADVLGWTDATSHSSNFARQLAVIDSIARHADNFSRKLKATLRAIPTVPPDLLTAHAEIEFASFLTALRFQRAEHKDMRQAAHEVGPCRSTERFTAAQLTRFSCGRPGGHGRTSRRRWPRQRAAPERTKLSAAPITCRYDTPMA